MISTDSYKKSSFSADGGCVEVRLLGDGNISLRRQGHHQARTLIHARGVA